MNVMKHAYLIIAHGDQQMLEYLLDALIDERNNLFVHIDTKANSINLQQLERKYKSCQVWFYKEINVRWGQESQVECEMFLLDKSLSQGKHDYYHIISGADYPIKSLDEIDAFFEKNRGREFVHYDQKEANAEALRRVFYLHPFNKMYKVTSSKVIHRLFFMADNLAVSLQHLVGYKKVCEYHVIQKGCNWCSITQELAEYVKFNEDKITTLIRKSRCADEVFIQTLVENSIFKERLYLKSYNNDYASCSRFIVWDENNKKSPKTLNIADYEQINNAEAVFGRKFNSVESKELIFKLKKRISKEVVYK